MIGGMPWHTCGVALRSSCTCLTTCSVLSTGLGFEQPAKLDPVGHGTHAESLAKTAVLEEGRRISFLDCMKYYY